MAHLHQHVGQTHINFSSIGQKLMRFGEIATAMKGIVETGLYLKDTLGPVVCWCSSPCCCLNTKNLIHDI